MRHFRRHLRRCFEREKIINIITEKDKIIKDKEKIVKEKDENLKEKDRQIYMLAQKVKGNSYTYILNCFANKAPALEKFSNFALIQTTKHNEKFSVAEIAIHYFQRKDLHKYLGDILVSIYKKKKPSEQSLWATDVSRLVYVVREKVKKKNVWSQDKGGIKTKFCIVQPILDHVYKKLDEYYTGGLHDSEIPATVIDSSGTIKAQDALIFFNFREDSMRQLVEAFVDKEFDIFEKKELNNLYVASLTQYLENPNLHVAFPIPEIKNGLAETLSKNGRKQYHIAETEKYAHVTYFFNCLKNAPFDGETDFLSESVKNPTENPEMKAGDIAEKVLSEIDRYDFFVINFANGDILSHFGNFEATVKGIQAIDEAVGKIKSAILIGL